MEIESWYKDHFERKIKGRYLPPQSIFPLLEMYNSKYEISVGGISELGIDIPLIKIGNGPKIVLGWSQMHGNESTTTKAIFDFLKFVSQKEAYQREIALFLDTCTFYVFPILNPDGAKAYTRENANGVDLNRDAQNLSQKESQCLRKTFDTLNPSLCLNLHDQRSIYGFDNGKTATVSFLSPAAGPERALTPARMEAMGQIVKMNAFLQKYIPGQVGRYDDSFNEACVGDTFQKLGVPAILFEAGHNGNDYQREKSREYIFYSLLSLFNMIGRNDITGSFKEYFNIPENKKNYNDFILRNVRLKAGESVVSVAIQYVEVLRNGVVDFVPVVDEIGNLKEKFGHRERDGEGAVVLTDSQENLTVGLKISKIVDKANNSAIYFQ